MHVDANTERLRDRIRSFVVMRGADAARGEHVIVFRTKCVYGGNDLVGNVRNHARFRHLNAKRRQEFCDGLEVHILGAAREKLIANEQYGGADAGFSHGANISPDDARVTALDLRSGTVLKVCDGDLPMAEIDYVKQLTERQAGLLPDHLGLEWLEARPGLVRGRFDVKPHHLAPNGFLHAASVIALADSASGYGCIISKPEGATGFTTIELKSNFLGTALKGGVAVRAELTHGGRTTQVWDAVVTNEETGKTMALFRCTQMILYPKS